MRRHFNTEDIEHPAAMVALGFFSLFTALSFAVNNLFFQSILFLFSIAAFTYSIRSFFGGKAYPYRPEIVFIPGMVWIGVQLLRHLSSQPLLVKILVLSEPMILIPCGIYMIFLIQQANNRIAGAWFVFLIVPAFFFRDPSNGFLTAILIAAQIPFAWVRQMERRAVYRSALFSIVFLSAYHGLLAKGVAPEAGVPQAWSFITAGSYCFSATIIRAVAWVCLFRGILLPFKPKRIQSRLRWAFFLNFMVPATLLAIVSVMMLLASVGGTQAASAKRLLFYYGSQAAKQASQLWEATHGIRRDPPAEVPFTRAGVIRLEDGSVQTMGPPLPTLVEALSSTHRYTVEFLTSHHPEWSLWIAGFHRAPDGSGTAIAYRVDKAMLHHIQNILGLDLMLTPGIDLSLYPLTGTAPIEDFITSLGNRISETDHVIFPAGAIFITSLAPLEHARHSLSVKPLATLKVLATWKSLSRSFMTADLSRQVNLFLGTRKTRHIPLPSTQAGDAEKNGTEDLESIQSINLLNFIIFIFLVVMGAVFAGVIFVSLSLSFFISRKINLSVSLLKSGTEQLHKGNLEHRIPVITEDELGILALDFNRMAESLQRYRAERESVMRERIEQEQIRREMQMAQDIHAALLPASAPIIEELDISAATRPCRMVGGDYFNFFTLSGGGIVTVIADVAGKGIPAALMVSTLHALLQTFGTNMDDPGIIANRLNSFLIQTTPENKFVTAIIAIWNKKTAELTVVSAGHEPPILIRGNGIIETLDCAGLLLGVVPDVSYETTKVHLSSGDTICFFTDGITDRLDPEGHRYGRENLLSTLLKTHTLTADHIIKHIFESVDTFGQTEPPPDDQTVIIIKKQ